MNTLNQLYKSGQLVTLVILMSGKIVGIMRQATVNMSTSCNYFFNSGVSLSQFWVDENQHIYYANGEILIFMDSDLSNLPQDAVKVQLR